MKRNTDRDSQIWCRHVKEKEGNLYFWIRDEKTEEEWVFYTSIEPEDADIYLDADDSLFIPQTTLDKAKLSRMTEQYQGFMQQRYK